MKIKVVCIQMKYAHSSKSKQNEIQGDRYYNKRVSKMQTKFRSMQLLNWQIDISVCNSCAKALSWLWATSRPSLLTFWKHINTEWWPIKTILWLSSTYSVQKYIFYWRRYISEWWWPNQRIFLEVHMSHNTCDRIC